MAIAWCGWIRAVVERLRSLQGAGESYSDVILALAKETTR
jgi:hypothetical protein